MNKVILSAAIGLFAMSCASTKKASEEPMQGVMLDPIEIFNPDIYRGARTKHIDILHTQLDVSFNWELQRMPGVAQITFKPYFYNINSVDFDAKGQDIEYVKLVTSTGKTDLEYTYQNDVIYVSLDRYYNRNEQLKIEIKYVAKPNERETSAGSAITSDKGLYFINPLGQDEHKPTQIWTQGEAEANSVWFPTVDAPNERCTHQISMTVDTQYVTLSNGELVSSKAQENGKRTDVWVQNKPIAPYLFMMAVSEFSVVTDSLDGMEVSYYVDPAYEPYAREIFAHTSEMITFYSDLLGYDYPWNKYSQAIVHDYVSGAMENVSAVIFGDFAHQTHQEMIDGNYEEVVSHELFHHWFGDVVTCESWANLPLNESFATYGEYLWDEYKHGKDYADASFDYNLSAYLRNVENSGAVDMIRFSYNRPDDMFDSHSYAKGGRILHMLRNLVGDEAFFESLKLYLHQNEYKSVEIHNLRLAFEEVTGQDLNWFFNQWFMGKGHPQLDITYSYDSAQAVQYVHVAQNQNTSEWGMFKFPVAIDVYVNGSVTRYDVMVDSLEQTFQFKVSQQPDLVNFDAEKILVCEKEDHHTLSEWQTLFAQGKNFMDQKEALVYAIKSTENEEATKQLILDAMLSKHSEIRVIAVDSYDKFNPTSDLKLKDMLISALKNDESSMVRSSAAYALYDNYTWADNMDKLFQSQLDADSSFMVKAGCISGLAVVDSVAGLASAEEYQDSYSNEIQYSVMEVFSVYGNEKHNDFFTKMYATATGWDRLGWANYYLDYLLRMKDEEVHSKALEQFNALASSDSHWYIKNVSFNAMVQLELYYQSLADANNDNETKANQYLELKKQANTYLAQLRLNEKDVRVFKNFNEE